MTVSRRNLRTFDNQSGRNVFFRAAIHPLTAALTRHLVAELAAAPRIAIYDPSGCFADLAAIHDLSSWRIEGVYVQRIEEIGQDRGGFIARPLTALPESTAPLLLVADFESDRLMSRLGPYRPAAASVISFDRLRLGRDFLTVPDRYLDPLNFVSDLLFFRDRAGLHTTVSSVNYWHGHGAPATRLWCRLFDGDGSVLATWEMDLPAAAGSIVLDSAEIRARFGLGDFAGSLFVHVIGAAAHDTLKYAIDIYDDSGETATATHDSNPWPAELYAGLPAPGPGQKVGLWVQNPYPAPIPAGAIGIRMVGAGDFSQIGPAIPSYGTASIDLAEAFPDTDWPRQFEIRADKHFCRPRYEIIDADGHRSVAHVNVERSDLAPAKDLPAATALLGKGFILPAPLLPIAEWSGTLLPTPMATWQDEQALIVRAYDSDGTQIAERPLGRLGRDRQAALAMDDLLGNAGGTPASGYGHIEIGYDFSRSDRGDGWIHAIFRYARRDTGRSAETSFGSHIFNVPALWRNEPNAYIGKPPGLSTRLYLRLTGRPGRVMCHLIYPTSGHWNPFSQTDLILYSAAGGETARRRIAIPCSGSRLIDTTEIFDRAELAEAKGGYVTIRDTTCRLFGYHLFVSSAGGFALDHMFGF